MKRILYILMASVILMSAATQANAQMGKRYYVNMGWQFNATPGNDFAKSAQGYGAYFESGYYLTPMLAIGGFMSFSTNNEYIDRFTYTFADQSALTTDLSRSIYQVPFGASLRMRFLRTEFQPYVEARIGTEYSTQSSYMSTFVRRDSNWGVYASPEVGLVWYPFDKADIGFQLAAYYSYSSNRNKNYDIRGINNLGFKLGIAF
ncbi:MAG: outer membrane beta-barrel protein [Bacteroidales bacterium]|nr:porin family protein [Bacteroidales bacterium]MBQ6688186.1 outer membrane beta-barrel protein [Bacteroidales bacterium]